MQNVVTELEKHGTGLQLFVHVFLSQGSLVAIQRVNRNERFPTSQDCFDAGCFCAHRNSECSFAFPTRSEPVSSSGEGLPMFSHQLSEGIKCVNPAVEYGLSMSNQMKAFINSGSVSPEEAAEYKKRRERLKTFPKMLDVGRNALRELQRPG